MVFYNKFYHLLLQSMCSMQDRRPLRCSLVLNEQYCVQLQGQTKFEIFNGYSLKSTFVFIIVFTCCQNCARRYILSFLKSQSIECIACTSASGAAGRLAAPVGCIRTSAPLSLSDHNDPSPSPSERAFKFRTRHF